MQGLSGEGQRVVQEVAQRHGVSADAVFGLLMALVAGGGTQAQFSHPDLGGMGQWSQGGMIMVGDMFNNGLKARVDALCNELSGLLRSTAMFAPAAPVRSQSQSQSQSGGGFGGGVSLFVSGGSIGRWPPELGAPSSTGSQNDLHYAVFPATRRLAIDRAGRVTVYDTGDHQIAGFSQQQSGDQSLTFTSQHGLVRVADLQVVDGGTAPAAPGAAAPAPMPSAMPPPPPPVPVAAPVAAAPAPISVAPVPPAHAGAEDDIFGKIERLADLRKKDILTAAEFEAKKAELLARL